MGGEKCDPASVTLPRASGSEVFFVCTYFCHTINLQNLEASEEAKTAWLSHSLSTTINCGVILKTNCDAILKTNCDAVLNINCYISVNAL